MKGDKDGGLVNANHFQGLQKEEEEKEKENGDSNEPCSLPFWPISFFIFLFLFVLVFGIAGVAIREVNTKVS